MSKISAKHSCLCLCMLPSSPTEAKATEIELNIKEPSTLESQLVQPLLVPLMSLPPWNFKANPSAVWHNHSFPGQCDSATSKMSPQYHIP